MAKELGYNRLFVTLSACLGCAFFGITMYFWGTMLPVVGADIENVSSLPWLLTLGIIIGTITCGSVVDRYGYKYLLIISSLSLSIGLVLFAFTSDFKLLVLSAILIGAGGGILNSETIAIISDIYDDAKRGVMLSILGGSYCLGSLIWTFVCRLLVKDPFLPIIWSSAIIFILSVLFIFIKFPKAKIAKGEDFSFNKFLYLIKNKLLLIVSFVLFFQGMVEAISANYSTSYLTQVEGGISKEIALTTLIFMTIGMTIGRFSLPLFIKLFTDKVSLFIFLSVAFTGALLQKFYPTSATVSIISMTIIGFGIGSTAPIIFNYLGKVFKKYSGIAVSIVVVVAQGGMLVGNFAIGKLFEGNCLYLGTYKLFPIILSVLILIVILSFPFVVTTSNNLKDKKLDL